MSKKCSNLSSTKIRLSSSFIERGRGIYTEIHHAPRDRGPPTRLVNIDCGLPRKRGPALFSPTKSGTRAQQRVAGSQLAHAAACRPGSGSTSRGSAVASRCHGYWIHAIDGACKLPESRSCARPTASDLRAQAHWRDAGSRRYRSRSFP